MTVVEAIPFSQHVLGFGGFGVTGVILVYVAPDVRQEIGSIPGLLERRAQAYEVALVLYQLVAEEGEVILFQS
jgi:hypothetical protein